jgi:hypothetical protein
MDSSIAKPVTASSFPVEPVQSVSASGVAFVPDVLANVRLQVVKGPKGEKRKADVIGNAILIAKIATGEAKDGVEETADDGKDPAAKALGKKGGEARAKSLSKKQRSEIAKKAAASRWKAR